MHVLYDLKTQYSMMMITTTATTNELLNKILQAILWTGEEYRQPSKSRKKTKLYLKEVQRITKKTHISIIVLNINDLSVPKYQPH